MDSEIFGSYEGKLLSLIVEMSRIQRLEEEVYALKGVLLLCAFVDRFVWSAVMFLTSLNG